MSIDLDLSNIDIAIIGGGNAALCAAITAAEKGASVIILETAPKPYRGGNSRHTRNFRCMHHGPLGPLQDSYLEEEYIADLLKVTEGNTDEQMARMVISASEDCLPWMQERGVHFQPALSGTLSLARTNAFFMGGGKSLVNAYYRHAESLGVKVLYEANVSHIQMEGSHAKKVEFSYGNQTHEFAPKAVIVAAGGFQSNFEWLEEAWGPAARNFLIRGTPYNRGDVLKDLLDQGVISIGDPTQCHAVAVDGRAPKYDGGIVTRLDCVPFSVVVNKNGKRFYDEGEDVWPKRYAIWGRLIADQPDQVAYAIIDSQSKDLFMTSVFPPETADTLSELTNKLGLPEDTVVDTIKNYNSACGDSSNFHPTQLDGVGTRGLIPTKSNWARPISKPPFYAYMLKTGITFTYLGFKVDNRARCYSKDGPIENLWAAGETMAGSILGKGYLAGFGMTIGTVFGRIAGSEAAQYVK